ncbi:hypothetical protein [Pedobacter agri]|uniref:hypothetical protein n=1 Tax=Pedobacter agri TaxID=454586 RepID=UPI002788A2E1|nr:hypothetical protein [Pedobacter agri]MDQ1142162.1 hypothetical protein [Pedobacter agri]
MKKLFCYNILCLAFAFNVSFAQNKDANIVIAESQLHKIDSLFKQYLDNGWIKGITANISVEGKTVYNNGVWKSAKSPIRN